MVAQYVGDRHKDWNEQLETLQFTINTAQHASTDTRPPS